MLDALGWRWEYKPIDLKGYIPDFVLIGPVDILHAMVLDVHAALCPPLLVEVKPDASLC